ncbi:MAG: NAD(+)/NADH kinase [Thermoguttaceae bacterium]|jgi:NAD+ kinase
MLKAILLGNGAREGVLEGVAALRPIIEQYVEVVAADFNNIVDLSKIDADIAFVFGGDGSILRSVHQMCMKQLPILAVNLGTLGFLSSVDSNEVESFLRSEAFRNMATREQILLNCSVWRKKEIGDEPYDYLTPASRLTSQAFPSGGVASATDRYCYSNHLVVNEVALRGVAPFSVLKINLAIDGDNVTIFRGDGLILSTPVGSTGHSLSAGGPIIRNTLDSVVISPLAPTTLNFRPVVDSASRVYEMQVKMGEVYLVIDGESRQKLTNDDLVVIRRAPFNFKMLIVPENKYYRNLRRKLGWAIDTISYHHDSKK